MLGSQHSYSNRLCVRPFVLRHAEVQCASVPLVPIRDGISSSQPIPGPAIESRRAVCFGNRHPVSSFPFSRRFSFVFLSFILSRRSETGRLDFLEDLSCRYTIIFTREIIHFSFFFQRRISRIEPEMTSIVLCRVYSNNNFFIEKYIFLCIVFFLEQMNYMVFTSARTKTDRKICSSSLSIFFA